jgi:hypothetical protein
MMNDTQGLYEHLLKIETNRNIEAVSFLFTEDDKFVLFVKTLLDQEKDIEFKSKLVQNISWIIFLQTQSRAFGFKHTFTPTPFQEKFQKYLYGSNRLATKNIPFEEWADLAEERLELLGKLIDDKRLEHFESDTRYLDLLRKFAARHEDLRLNKGYNQLNEFMDD